MFSWNFLIVLVASKGGKRKNRCENNFPFMFGRRRLFMKWKQEIFIWLKHETEQKLRLKVNTDASVKNSSSVAVKLQQTISSVETCDAGKLTWRFMSHFSSPRLSFSLVHHGRRYH